MEIKFQIHGRVFSVCIGHKTDWFEQMPFFTITEEFHGEKKEVVYANYIWGFGGGRRRE